MRVSMEQAGERFEELVERAERGEPVIITRDGQDAIALRPVETNDRRHELTLEERRAIIKDIMAKAPPRSRVSPSQTEATTFFMTRTVFQRDRDRHIRADCCHKE